MSTLPSAIPEYIPYIPLYYSILSVAENKRTEWKNMPSTGIVHYIVDEKDLLYEKKIISCHEFLLTLSLNFFKFISHPCFHPCGC